MLSRGKESQRESPATDYTAVEIETAMRAANRSILRRSVRPQVMRRELFDHPAIERIAPDTRPESIRNFVDEVRGALDEGLILRYSQRVRLMKLAGKHGIGRFDANLIIAAVQHRAGPVQQETTKSIASNSRGVPTVAIALIVQGMIVFAGWWMLWR